jgi:hypothetical protein
VAIVRRGKSRRPMSARGHVWTTPAGQGILAFSLRSGASHVSGLFARRTWPLALM